MKKLSEATYRVLVRYGFMDRTDIRAAMRILEKNHLKINPEDTTCFLSRDTVIPAPSVGMSIWRDRLFLLLRRNSARACRYFNLPPHRVLEIGAHIKF